MRRTGEFTFVTLSRELDGQRSVITMRGMGYHEYRERWITNHWYWYNANAFPEMLKQRMALEAAQEFLAQRRAEIAPYGTNEPQTSRGQLFELLAELMDEDGAWAELEDLGEAADWLLADEPPVDSNDDDNPPQTRSMFMMRGRRNELAASGSSKRRRFSRPIDDGIRVLFLYRLTSHSHAAKIS